MNAASPRARARRHAWRQPPAHGRIFLRWARFPFFEIDDSNAEVAVYIIDARYTVDRNGLFGAVRIPLPIAVGGTQTRKQLIGAGNERQCSSALSRRQHHCPRARRSEKPRRCPTCARSARALVANDPLVVSSRNKEQ